MERVHDLTGGIPRRINRLCSRVLLAGALEKVDLLTIRMVEETAEELEADLGAGLKPGEEPVPLAIPDNGDVAILRAAVEGLAKRLDTLEQSSRRRERMLGQLADLVAQYAKRSDATP
jgi:hypothetical protein